MARKKTTPVELLVETQQKRNHALSLRLSGKSQQQIADEMKVHKSTVSLWLKDAIADITRENAEEYLHLELARLDVMFESIWRRTAAPKNDEERKGQTWLIDRALAIMDQRAKLTGTYKAADLKAVAEAKGNVGDDAISMVDSLLTALDTYAKGKAAQDHDDESAADPEAA